MFDSVSSRQRVTNDSIRLANGHPRKRQRGLLNLSAKESFVYVAIALLICGLALAASYGEKINRKQSAATSRAAAENELGHIRSRLETNLRGDVQLAKGLVSFVANHPQITQYEFSRAAKPLFDGGSNLRNIGAAPNMVIHMMYPLAGNEKAIGLDFRKTPTQFETADQARTTGRLILAGPLQLVQGGNGIVGRIPVFVEDKHGKQKFWGLISAVIDADRLFLISGLMDSDNPLEISIRGKDGKGSRGEVFFGRPELFDANPVLADVALPNGSWQMAAVPRGGWPVQPDNTWLLRLVFFMIGLLILVPFFALVRATGALGNAQKQSEAERRRLLATLESTPNVAVQWYDRAARVIYWNLASEKIFGWTSSEAVGKTLDQLIYTPEQAQQFADMLTLVAKTEKPTPPTDSEARHRDGSTRIINSTLFSMPGDLDPFFVCMDVDITERVQAEKALRENRELLNTIVKILPTGLWILDAEGKVVFSNNAAQRIWAGVRYVGIEQFAEYKGWRPNSGKPVAPHEWAGARALEKGESVFEEEVEIECFDGSRKIILDSAVPILRSDGSIGGAVTVNLDVTERVRAEQTLKRSKDQLVAILNATTESIFHIDADGIILAINTIAAHRVRKQPEDMIGKCAFDFFPPEVAASRRRSLAEVFRSGKEQHTEDTRNDRYFSLNYYPVFDNDCKIGSAVVYAADITERRNSQLRLERLLAEQRSLLENDLIGIVTVKDRKIVWANPAFEKILGYDPGELAGTPTRQNYPSDEAYEVFGAAAYPMLSSGKIFRAQIEHVRKDGKHIWVDLSGTTLDRDTGESMWGFIDITERVQAEKALLEQKNFLTTILENEPECVKVMDSDGKLLQMNAAGLSMLGAGSIEEINACGLLDFVIPEHRVAFKKLSHRVFKGEAGVLEFEIQTRQGALRWLETHAAPLRNAEGKVTHLLGVTRDVTRRREAEERLALSLRGADLAITDWYIPGDTIYFGEGWTKLLGYQGDELPSNSASMAKLFHKEDAQTASEALVRHLKGETPYLETEMRMRHKDGHWVWVLARGMAVERSADGRAVRVSGTGMDVTGRKQAESEIARLSQWNELLLNSAGEGIYGVDQEGRCTFINPTALAILGFSKEEVLGKNQHVVFHHHHKDGSPYPAEECPIYQTLHDGIRRGVEDAFIRKNGEIFPVQLTVTPMHENGQIVGVEAVFQDIAQRKEMEQELMRLATTDPLTGMANRRHFIEQLEMELAHCKRFGTSAAFLMVDLDHFKSVNDTHGHAAGDLVLKHFAELTKQRLRRVDLLGRLGGEEFGILLPGTDSAGAELFAERLRSYVADTPGHSVNATIPITISIGISLFSAKDPEADSIMARADIALYRAKEGGRNRVEVM